MAKQNYITSVDITKTLEEFSIKRSVPLEQIDFTILKTENFIRTAENPKWESLSPEAYRYYLENRQELIAHRVEFNQRYAIRLTKKVPSKLFRLVYELQLGRYNTQPKLRITTESRFNLKAVPASKMYEALLAEIRKIQAEHNLLVGLFAYQLQVDLKTLVKKLYTKQFTDDVTITLFEGVEPVLENKGGIHYEYLKKKPTKKMEDKAIYEVDEDELLLFHEEPIVVLEGFKAEGKILTIEEIMNANKADCDFHMETVRMHRLEKRTEFYARSKGYITHTLNWLEVRKSLEKDTFTRFDNQQLESEDNDIEVKVTEADLTRDGLASGSELISERVHITGAVGHNAKIRAKKVLIDGMTHSSSHIEAKEVRINRHIGSLRASKVEINSLEGGTIYATEVHIKSALSGTVYAERITVDLMKSNITFHASSSITIGRLLGEDNQFIISSEAIDTHQKKLAYYRHEIEDIKEDLAAAVKRKEREKALSLKEGLENKRNELLSHEYDPFRAKITIESPTSGVNVIRFHAGESVLTFRTQGEREYEPFYLRTYETEEAKVIKLEPTDVLVELPFT